MEGGQSRSNREAVILIHVHTKLELELVHSMGLLIRLAAHPERLKAIQGEESLQLPVSFSDSYSDSLGNPISRLRLNAGIHTIEYRLSAAQPCFGAGLDPLLGFTPLSELPTDTLAFLQPSRYVDSDRLGTAAFEVVEGTKNAGEQVLALFDWVRETLPYRPGMSAQPLSASEVIKAGQGVCRDLAHVLIGMVRAISIPARYVVGYVRGLEPQDVHAWAEIYIAGRWLHLDPTFPTQNAQRVPVIHGRDAADVAIMDQFGPLPLRSEMQVTVW